MKNEVVMMNREVLVEYPNNPYKVRLDAEMVQLIESIEEYGVLVPLIVWKNEKGKYEIVSGHRRKWACVYLGIDSLPVIVKELDRNMAAVMLVESNMQREKVLPSEKGFAYKLRLEALQEIRTQEKNAGGQVVHEKRSRDELAETSEESGRQIQRYIRLTKLIPKLLELVDEKRIALTPAVALSYLDVESQDIIHEIIEYEDMTPSLHQATVMKELYQQGLLDYESIVNIMAEQKPNQKEQIKIKRELISHFFPEDYSSKQIEQVIIKLLADWRKREDRKRANRDSR